MITARITDASAGPAASAHFTTAPEVHRMTFSHDGLFLRPNGRRVTALGGLYLPWWAKVVDGRAQKLMWKAPLVLVSESDCSGVTETSKAVERSDACMT